MKELYPVPRESAKVFDGPLMEQMPKLKSEGYNLPEVRWLAEKSYEYRNSRECVLPNLYTGFFNLGSFVVHPNGSVDLVKPNYLKNNLNPETPIVNGRMTVTSDTPLEFMARFSKSEVKKYTGGSFGFTAYQFSKRRAKNHPIWKILLGDMLSDFVDWFYSSFRFHDHRGPMEVDFTLALRPPHTEQSGLGIMGLDGCYRGFNIMGWDLNSWSGKALGVAPEKSLEARV